MSVPAQGHHDDDSYGAPEGGHGAGDSAPQGTHEHSVTAFRRPDTQGSTAHEHRIKPRNSAGRDLKSAIGVGVGLGAVVLLAIFVIPGGWYPLVALAAAAATWEVHSRLKEHGYVVSLPTVLVGGQVMLWSSLFFGVEGLIAGFVTSVLALMFGRLFYHGRHSAPQNYLRDAAIGVFVLTWIPLFASFAAMLSQISGESVSGRYYIVTFMLCVIASDTGGYITGVLFGKNPMAPAVSPKKSWGGFCGFCAIWRGHWCVVRTFSDPRVLVEWSNPWAVFGGVRHVGGSCGVAVQARTRNQGYVQYFAWPRRCDGPAGWDAAFRHGHMAHSQLDNAHVIEQGYLAGRA